MKEGIQLREAVAVYLLKGMTIRRGSLQLFIGLAGGDRHCEYGKRDFRTRLPRALPNTLSIIRFSKV